MANVPEPERKVDTGHGWTKERRTDPETPVPDDPGDRAGADRFHWASRVHHYRPRRHKKARTTAVSIFAGALVLHLLGWAGMFLAPLGWPATLAAAVTLAMVLVLVVTPSMYFLYMENLEPKNYRHETPMRPEQTRTRRRARTRRAGS